ncbi:MAG: hypothetical protein HY200_01850 [Nitrospirae bacterium]|nr:hypothetical protein [Nitrospirota bacterium]MBI3593679.1 hypothetical protein [Nitrospirota bacterium]
MGNTFYTKVFVMIGFLMFALSAHAGNFEMTPTVQAQLDKEKAVIASWASDPLIVKAVQLQNKKGPIPGIDNAAWKVTRRSDPVIKAFQENPVGQFLKDKIETKDSAFSEAFLSAGKGEKVAFVEKTTYYIHKGMPKFDIPFNEGKTWQGKPEFDESSQTYAVQVSTPILSEGKPIGVLVVGVNLSFLEKVSKK